MQQHNIVIVGAGPIGLSLALSLAQSDMTVTLIDPLLNKNNDGRVLALSFASYAYLKQLGGWPAEDSTPIKRVHISHSGFGISHINASDVALEHLGYTVKYTDLCAKLLVKIKNHPNIQLLDATVKDIILQKNQLIIEDIDQNATCLTADIIMIAEGGKMAISGVEYANKYDYQQTALIAELKVEKSYDQIAFERFSDNGAMVLLPYKKNYILVWSINSLYAESLLQNNRLVDELNKQPFMQRFAKIELVNQLHTFPLTLQIAKSRVLGNLILVGNSAQIVHPVSAQGLNLGFRDVAAITDLLVASQQGELNQTLEQYDGLRNADTKFVSMFTHYLVKIIESQFLPTKLLRSIGIIGLSNCKFLQNKITNSLIFGV